MKTGLIAGLMVIVALGGALGAVAADRTIRASVVVETEFTVDLDSSTAMVRTRTEGGAWLPPESVPLRQHPIVRTQLVSGTVRTVIPVSFEVEVPDPELGANPQVTHRGAPTGQGTCCRVLGMSDAPSAQRATMAAMQRVIAYARTNFGLTHEGPITINISYTQDGLKVRYQDAFGESLEELPNECSFQRGEHMFFGPACRLDETAIAREWFVRATRARNVSATWAGVATIDYYWTLYQEGEPPSLRDDRYRSAIFWEPAENARAGRAGEALMAAVALYAVESYGTFDDWLAFYDDLQAGAEVHAAFEAAFGVSLSELYTDFEAWAAQQKAIMLATAFKSCQEAARNIQARPREDGGGFADFHVPLEWDEDGDGYVCEQYSRFDQEELTCLVVGDLSPDEEGQ